MGKAPVLGQVRNTYGSKAAETIIIAQLVDYNNFIGVKEDGKNNVAQISELAQMILANYAYLKLSDILLFFAMLKRGEFGKTYGSINPQDIMIALREYMNRRNYIIERYESKQREIERQEHKKHAISREQWEELKKQRENESRLAKTPQRDKE